MVKKVGNINTPPSSVKRSGRSGGVSAGKKTSTARGSSQNNSAQAVSVSSTDQIATAMSSDSSQRTEKVSQIKLEVESGDYKLDSQKTADKLVDSLTDYSLA